jgi:hypothetical protein
MGKLPKVAKQDTTTLILDLKNSKFEELSKYYQIWEYELPPYMRPKRRDDYAKNHIWARSVTDNPYYLHSTKNESPKLYIAYKDGDSVENIQAESYLLPKIPFNINAPKNYHCLLKVLMSCYVHQENKFVSNNKFYLLVKHFSSKRGNDYFTVLKINPSLNQQKNIQHKETGLYELELQDSATRLKKITFGNKSKWQIPFDLMELENEQIILKQLKINDSIDDSYPIYEENTDKSFRVSVEYHNIQNVEKFEKSRNTLLDNFSKELITFFNSLGIVTKSKELTLEKVVNKLSTNNLEYNNFNISIFDMRFNKSVSLKNIIDNFNEFDSNIHFKEGNVLSSSQKRNVLILMDYSTGDCKVAGVLSEFKENDGYKITKKAGFKVSQGFCLNLNHFEDDAKKIKLSKDDFLKYDAEWKSGKFEDKNLERDFKICIQQLYLKSIAQKSLKFGIPKIEFIENTVFIHCFSKKIEKRTVRYEYICYTENRQLFFIKLDSEHANQILKKYGINDKFALIQLWKNFNPFWSKFNTGDKYIILNKQGIIEIKELKERVLYSSNIGDIIEHRATEYEKSNFRLPLDNEHFNEQQVNKYNSYIENEIEDYISFDELVKGGKKGKYRKEIFSILGVGKREDKLSEVLSFKGKRSGGFLSVFQGVWFDESKNQYFVGSKDSYNSNQVKGHRIRRIEILRGSFDKDYFFPLLNVDFVKHKNYTVLPYPFNLIKMYITMNTLKS